MLPLGDATLPWATTVPAGTGVIVGAGGGGAAGAGDAVGVALMTPVLGVARGVGFADDVACGVRLGLESACAPSPKSAQPVRTAVAAITAPAAASPRSGLRVSPIDSPPGDANRSPLDRVPAPQSDRIQPHPHHADQAAR